MFFAKTTNGNKNWIFILSIFQVDFNYQNNYNNNYPFKWMNVKNDHFLLDMATIHDEREL